MKKIVLCGNYGGINTGDEAILQGFLSVLQGHADVTVLSHNPAHTFREYGVKSRYVFPMGLRSMIKHTINGQKNKTIRAIKAADYFILGGGSLFTDEESAKAPLMWSWQARAAASCKTKVIMFGQTVGPIKSAYLRNLTAETFNIAEQIFVRDSQSKQFLEEIGVSKPIATTGDCALLLARAAQYNPEGPVLFIPRDWPNGPRIEAIAKVIKQATKKDVKILSLYRDRENFEPSNTPERTACISPQSLMAEMQQSSLVVSMRLHGNILAANSGVPFIPLSYSPKVNNFIDEIGYPFIFNWENFSVEELRNALKKVYTYRLDNIAENIQNKAAELEGYLKTFL